MSQHVGGGSVWRSEDRQQEGRLPIATSGAEVQPKEGLISHNVTYFLLEFISKIYQYLYVLCYFIFIFKNLPISYVFRRLNGRIRKLRRRKIQTSNCDTQEKKRNRNGVGILIDKSLKNGVVAVRRQGDKIIMIKLIFGDLVLNIISAYAPQVGLSDDVKRRF
jgi:hypothetical protein